MAKQNTLAINDVAFIEVLLTRHQLEGDSKLALLGRAAHLDEITPWQLGTDPETTEIVRQIKHLATSDAGASPAKLAHKVFAWLDNWYSKPRNQLGDVLNLTRNSSEPLAIYSFWRNFSPSSACR